jgi:hypothetical protein
MHRDWKRGLAEGESWRARGSGGVREYPHATEAVMMLRRDRPRQIDAVIDYFGESRSGRARRPGPTLRATGQNAAWADRFALAGADKMSQIPRSIGTRGRPSKGIPCGC